jgi:hypothetical protein
MKTRRRAADHPESEEAQWDLRVAQPGSDTIWWPSRQLAAEKLPRPAEVWPR